MNNANIENRLKTRKIPRYKKISRE